MSTEAGTTVTLTRRVGTPAQVAYAPSIAVFLAASKSATAPDAVRVKRTTALGTSSEGVTTGSATGGGGEGGGGDGRGGGGDGEGGGGSGDGGGGDGRGG